MITLNIVIRFNGDRIETSRNVSKYRLVNESLQDIASKFVDQIVKAFPLFTFIRIDSKEFGNILCAMPKTYRKY